MEEDDPSDGLPPIPASPTSDGEVNLEKVSPSSGPWSAALLSKARKLKLTEDDPSLRRSTRQKDLKKGLQAQNLSI